ncbi:inactive serine/threonine-protein kinase PLK5 isoform X2 [Mesocricetus auratus]|uniref:Serine/threonine-protein kinase PLK n=1 Tax=Mesocricetus auratus TaxID=10036 RepID=A0ABM2WYE0_MESAU|nr:inactive serine/threonine-protein kinase PLK5 isoform X2 [Mesocricetus auratus]
MNPRLRGRPLCEGTGESTGLRFPRWANPTLSTGPRRRRGRRAVGLSLTPGWGQSSRHSTRALAGSHGRPGPAPPRPHSPIRPASTVGGAQSGDATGGTGRHRATQSPLPLRARAHPAQMESRSQRRRRSRQLVAAFLHDPGSGRVYRRGKLIGKGAFSRCYKLTDMSTSAVFALKVVPRGGAGRLRLRGKVEREIALHSRLRHRNIVAFHGHFADRDHVYMVLEYCSRQSLAHVLKARRTLTEPEVRYYLRGVVSGLRYLHQHRIVHRDLKPSNFFLSQDMEVKIGDLGLAARVGPAGHCHRVLCGTPSFQAPEVVSRHGHSCKSDIWALGCIMYTVLTGTPPFTATPLSEMYQNIRDGHYPEPTHLSPSARNLISRLLAPDPAERPSLDHLLEDDFFTQGFTPERLPPHSCHSPPVFAFPPPLSRLFRKVGQLLLTQCRASCPFTSKEASGPGEEGTEPDHVEPSSEEGAPLCAKSRVHILTLGTRRTELADSKGSLALQVELATRKLRLCLDTGTVAAQDPQGEQRPVLWAPKWVDYSLKYGVGYQLSDGGSGVLFRDGSHMALRPPGGHVSYQPDQGTLWTFTLRDVPSPLRAKLAVLRLFACYMQRRVREEGTVSMPVTPASPDLSLLGVVADSRALLLLFSNGTLQVSFRTSQTQLVLSGEGEGFLLTLWEPGGPSTGVSYSLDALQSHGCTPTVQQHLRQGLRLLQSV